MLTTWSQNLPWKCQDCPTLHYWWLGFTSAKWIILRMGMESTKWDLEQNGSRFNPVSIIHSRGSTFLPLWCQQSPLQGRCWGSKEVSYVEYLAHIGAQQGEKGWHFTILSPLNTTYEAQGCLNKWLKLTQKVLINSLTTVYWSFNSIFWGSLMFSCFSKTLYECRLLWIYNQRKDIILLDFFPLPAEPYRKAVTMDKGIIS